MPVVSLIARSRQGEHFLEQRLFDGPQPQRNQCLNHRERDRCGQRPIIQWHGLLHGRRLLVLSRLLSYSWHGWCPREKEWRSVTGFTLFYRGTT